MAEHVCAECREPIDAAASVCPHCGHDPAAAHQKAASRRLLAGGLLILTIVGSPLGAWLVWKARKHSKAGQRASPAVEV
jgi:hypothetical protein